jgi:YidC/Oxa1 family membrane protein insertase
VPDRTATVETPLYRAAITSRGGEIQSWVLDYRGQKPMIVPGLLGPSGLRILRQGLPPRIIGFRLSAASLKLDNATPRGQLELVGGDGAGLRITQVLRFQADSYLIEREIRIENRKAVAETVEADLSWVAPTQWPKEQEDFRGPRPIHVVNLVENAFWARREYLGKAEKFQGEARWVAFESGVAPTGQNGVFLTALIPKGPGIKVFTETLSERNADQGKEPTAVAIGVRVSVRELSPGQAWKGTVLSYLGPMEYDRLTAVGANLEKAIYFGGLPLPESWAARYGAPTFPMQWIVVPTLWLMHWVYGFSRNYGIAIMVLTIVTKVLFFPLTVKGMASMKAMQTLQPQVNALKAKHQKDPQRAQRETMELYKKHGVNPMGGCLPMVVQIPIFYALYAALSVSADLQNAPFIQIGTVPSGIPWLGGQCLWICDLAQQDPTYLLPILMGVSMFIQQKMSPTVGDPRQAKIMLVMPVVFTFMFLNLPSGLVLYWTLSNILQIVQQHYMDRRGRSPKVAAKEVQ